MTFGTSGADTPASPPLRTLPTLDDDAGPRAPLWLPLGAALLGSASLVAGRNVVTRALSLLGPALPVRPYPIDAWGHLQTAAPYLALGAGLLLLVRLPRSWSVLLTLGTVMAAARWLMFDRYPDGGGSSDLPVAVFIALSPAAVIVLVALLGAARSLAPRSHAAALVVTATAFCAPFLNLAWLNLRDGPIGPGGLVGVGSLTDEILLGAGVLGGLLGLGTLAYARPERGPEVPGRMLAAVGLAILLPLAATLLAGPRLDPSLGDETVPFDRLLLFQARQGAVLLVVVLLLALLAGRRVLVAVALMAAAAAGTMPGGVLGAAVVTERWAVASAVLAVALVAGVLAAASRWRTRVATAGLVTCAVTVLAVDALDPLGQPSAGRWLAGVAALAAIGLTVPAVAGTAAALLVASPEALLLVPAAIGVPAIAAAQSAMPLSVDDLSRAAELSVWNPADVPTSVTLLVLAALATGALSTHQRRQTTPPLTPDP